jgi:hypothetical protein
MKRSGLPGARPSRTGALRSGARALWRGTAARQRPSGGPSTARSSGRPPRRPHPPPRVPPRAPLPPLGLSATFPTQDLTRADRLVVVFDAPVTADGTMPALTGDPFRCTPPARWPLGMGWARPLGVRPGRTARVRCRRDDAADARPRGARRAPPSAPVSRPRGARRTWPSTAHVSPAADATHVTMELRFNAAVCRGGPSSLRCVWNHGSATSSSLERARPRRQPRVQRPSQATGSAPAAVQPPGIEFVLLTRGRCLEARGPRGAAGHAVAGR